MNPIVWLFKCLLKAAIFFTLFAFALNNQSDVIVNLFFGVRWTAPLVLVILLAFAMGLTIGVLGMVPRWWQHKRTAPVSRKESAPASTVHRDTEQAAISRPHGL